MTNTVSVITTFFNAENYLAEAIESVLAQRNFDNWELILVDDGSSDDSALIAHGYAKDFSHKIRVVAHPNRANRGISAARNLGFAHARGESIAFLDADDVWLPEKLAEQTNLLRRHKNVAMIYGVAERWFDWDAPRAANAGKDLSTFSASNAHTTTILPGGANALIEPPDLLRAFLQDESLTPCVCTIIVRRAAFAACNGFSEAFPGLYEDQVFYAKLALRFPVYAAKNCWARYRQHAASCCATAWRDNAHKTARQKFLLWLRDYLALGDDCRVEKSELARILEIELSKIGAV